MRILAIDPGPEQSGFVLYERLPGQSLGQVVDADVAKNHVVMLLAKSPGADQLVIEMIASYGMPVGREVFETCVWIGRFQESWVYPENVRKIVRKDVKMHLCGSARAKDSNVWQALLDKFGPVGTKAAPGLLYGVKSHARAALALAVTADETFKP